jgi:hypothetical protein
MRLAAFRVAYDVARFILLGPLTVCASDLLPRDEHSHVSLHVVHLPYLLHFRVDHPVDFHDFVKSSSLDSGLAPRARRATIPPASNRHARLQRHAFRIRSPSSSNQRFDLTRTSWETRPSA